jgi:hypothetical protein
VARKLVGPRTVTITGVVLLFVGASLIGGVIAATGASASGQTLTVSPHSGLKAGSSVVARGTGFTRGANGVVLQCNDSPGQPATVISIHGVTHAIPVGCTSPLAATTSRRGKLGATHLTIATGALGAWESGPDSSGNSASADSAAYPCPPTSAQIGLGVSCIVEFLDNKGEVGTRSISFKTPRGTKPPPTSTTTTVTSTTMVPTSTTTQPCEAEPVTAGPAAGPESLTVNPGTCLVDGTVTSLTGSGFTADVPGTFVECNSDPNQPTVAMSGAVVPVSCTNALADPPGPGVVDTSPTGALGPVDFAVVEGTVGPPCGPSSCTGPAATDSTGGNPSTDAAAYPCPPTPAQQAAGDICGITFTDDSDDLPVTVPISFNPAVPVPPQSASTKGVRRARPQHQP